MTKRDLLIETMKTTLEYTGYRIIGALTLNDPQPPAIRGMKSTHQPDIFFQGTRPGVLAVVTAADLEDPKISERLFLFSKFAEACGGDFFVSCFAAISEPLKKLCEARRIRYSKLFEV